MIGCDRRSLQRGYIQADRPHHGTSINAILSDTNPYVIETLLQSGFEIVTTKHAMCTIKS